MVVNKWSRVALLGLLSCAGACSQPGEHRAEPADLVLRGGSVYTMDAGQPRVEAVAIRDGAYTALGSNTRIGTFVGPDTKVIELNGRMAMPGINEVHAHSWQGGIKALYECNFPFTATPEEIAAIVTGCVAANPDAQWITGGQWTSDFFIDNDIGTPRLWLDALSGDKAVYFEDDATHNAWVNTRALELAGVTADTPDPPGGRYLRDANGVPNGLVLETAMPLLASHIPEWTHEQNLAALAEAVRLANAYGLTGINEARTPPEVLDAYRALDHSGGLTAHAITHQQTPRGTRREPFDVGPLVDRAQGDASGHVHARFAKLFLDGVPTASRTAVMLEAYLPDETHDNAANGELLIDADTLAADLMALDAAGVTVKIHAAGDGAVRVALDAIEQVREANGSSGLRHEIAHAGFIHPGDVPRFAVLDVTADLSPYLWYPRPIITSIIGAVGERALEYWPVRDLIDAGADLAAGSDWPSVAASMNPWPAIEALVTRRDPDSDSGDAYWPEQAITLAEALEIFTLGGARAYRLEDRTGSVAVGKSADLIVLDRHLFEIPVEAVSNTRVALTLFEGEVVFRNEALW